MRINGLTLKQHRVAALVADALTDKQIAARLEISVDGVDWHVRRIVVAWELDRTRNIRVQITNRFHAQAA